MVALVQRIDHWKLPLSEKSELHIISVSYLTRIKCNVLTYIIQNDCKLYENCVLACTLKAELIYFVRIQRNRLRSAAHLADRPQKTRGTQSAQLYMMPYGLDHLYLTINMWHVPKM